MEIDREKQTKARKSTRELLAHKERQRAECRLLRLVLDLEKGGGEVLLDDELMERLPGLLTTCSETDNLDRIRVLFDKLSACACSENYLLRERAVMALSLCMVGITWEDHPEHIECITRGLLSWLRVETEFFPVCATVCKQLQQQGTRLLEEGLWRECAPLLEVFSQIQTGVGDKSHAIRSVVGRAQDGVATDYILEELTLVWLRGRGQRKENAGQILLNLGRRAAIHLLETLLSCRDKEDRHGLIALIADTGYVVHSVLEEYLEKDLTWYGYCNIILIVEVMIEPELLPLVLPCLEHEDVRVQQQVLDCILAVAPKDPTPYLRAALPLVADPLKLDLIEILAKDVSPAILDAFLDLLAQRDGFSPEMRDELLQRLVVHLRLSDSVRAVNLLTMLLEERQEAFDPHDDPVSQAVSLALQVLAPHYGAKAGVVKGLSEQGLLDIAAESVSFDGDPAALNPAKREMQKINEAVAVLLGQDQADKAGRLLYEKCVEAAQEKKFEIAEMLRDRILEVDPQALAEVITAGERIEEERLSVLTPGHISIWKDLYDSLTTEEFNALYQALQLRTFAAGDIIVELRTNNPYLYFINSGQVSLSSWRGDEEIFLKKVGPGEIVGSVPFFDASLWTVGLTALSLTTVHVLERREFLALLVQYPGLEPCLLEYCIKCDQVPELIRMSGEDRRQYPRYPVTVLVRHTLLNESGEPSMRSFKGEIIDLSAGGFSFHIRISRKENARLLLGRKIRTTIPEPAGGAVECSGQIVAVRYQASVESDYSVHVLLEAPLAEAVVKRIVAIKQVSVR